MSQEAQNPEVAATAAKVRSPKVVKEKVKLVKATLAQEIQNGEKIQYFIDKYGLCEAQMRKALKAAGLKIRSFREPEFEFEDEAQPENQLNLFEAGAEAKPTEEAEQIEIQTVVATEVADANIQEVAAVQAEPVAGVDF